MSLKVAGIQMASKVGDVKGNVEKACHAIEEVAKQGAKLICLPELTIFSVLAILTLICPLSTAKLKIFGWLVRVNFV